MGEGNQGISRRGFLGGAAKTAAAAAVASAVVQIPGLAEAQQRAAEGSGSSANDAAALNSALSLEYTAIKAYDAGIGILNAQHDAVAPVAKAVAQHFQSQHRSHADALAEAVRSLGGTPVDAASVTFTPPAGFPAQPNTTHVLKLAANLEKQAALAYINAIKVLSNGTLAQAAASLSGTETQHWIVLYLLINGEVAPTAAADPNDIAPKSFVTPIGSGTQGLESVPDFTYGGAAATTGSTTPAGNTEPAQGNGAAGGTGNTGAGHTTGHPAGGHTGGATHHGGGAHHGH